MIGSLEIGGAETQLVRLANGLDRSRFQPSVISMWHGGPLRDMLAPDIEVTFAYPSTQEQRRRNRLVFGARILAALAGSIREQRPDIVHGYLPAAYVPAALTASALRVPAIVAGRRGLTPINVYGAAWGRVAALANRAIDLHICNSKAVRDFAIAQEHLPPARTRVIYNGLDIPTRTALPAIPADWRAGEATAGMVANFISYKGHSAVLRAVARVVARHPDFKLVLIGEGPERPRLERLIGDLRIDGNVVLAGGRADASELMAGFDFTLLGSSQEGLPNVLMESMALGVPVVSTSVGGVQELVENRVHGLLVAFGDLEAMADAIAWMIEHPQERRAMGEAARLRIAEQFSTERMVKATQEAYESLVGKADTVSAGDRVANLER